VTVIGLGLVLAFEPPEADVMSRPPRAPNAPILSRDLLWQIVFVSVLIVIGAFGMFAWAASRGLSDEAARTLVVNAIVVMQIVYLFSVRYLRSTALTWQGALGTPPVLIGVGGTIILQLAFTYAPFMQRLFDTRAVSLRDGIAVIALGILMLLIVEAEKRLRSGGSRPLR
jgi:magnesium-transporting ATPase (P-type)